MKYVQPEVWRAAAADFAQDLHGLNGTRHCFSKEDDRVTLDTQHGPRLVGRVAVYL